MRRWQFANVAEALSAEERKAKKFTFIASTVSSKFLRALATAEGACLALPCSALALEALRTDAAPWVVYSVSRSPRPFRSTRALWVHSTSVGRVRSDESASWCATQASSSTKL